MKNSQPETANRADFKAKQLEFAAYIRDPENNPAPTDVKAQRMDMYRELFFNNVESFLSSSFPVLRSILDDQQWFKLAQDFFASHRCQSPYFSEIPEEFLDYLQNERDNPEDLPFLLELAHYEWVETALAIAKVDVVANSHDDIDTLLHKRIALSPLAWPLAYQYPVHQISPDFVPAAAPEQPTFLIVYRNIDDEVHFSLITGITYRLLQLIQENEGLTAEDYLKQVAQEANHPDPALIVEGGLAILKEWAEKTIITIIA